MRVLAKVHAQLQANHNVIFHAPHLATERLALLAKHVDCALELHGVHMELLAQAAGVLLGALRDQRLGDAHALLAQHGVEQCAHAVLDILRGQHAKALGGVVDAEAQVRSAREMTLVVLGLEAKVALHHHHNLTEAKHVVLLDAGNVALQELKLPRGFC